MDFFCPLASSSSGNAYLLRKGKTLLLIDAGISCARISAGLSNFGLCPGDISAILITHEHTDHTNGLRVLMKRSGAPVYLTNGTNQAVKLEGERARTYSAGDKFTVGDIEVSTFKTPHDARESVGLRFDASNFSLGFATDMGYMPFEGEELLQGVKFALIEANYDREMLIGGPYPYYLKQRISSTRGHQENSDCGDLAARLVKNGAEGIMLAHISRNNNTPGIAREAVCARLCCEGIKPEKDLELMLAPHDEPGQPVRLG